MRHDLETAAIGTIQTIYRPRVRNSAGWMEVNPTFAEHFAARGIDSPDGVLELPGEVVGGHPDRHVVRVQLSGLSSVFYLKRQHTVSRREKWRNWITGFGWVSRCEREWSILKQLTAAALPCPTWAAVGADGRGRAFLLVEEVTGAVDLRQFLNDNALSQSERLQLAKRLGGTIAKYHGAGFTTPELCAKHVLISPENNDITLIDWQSAVRLRSVHFGNRLRCLGALQASVPETAVSLRERLTVVRAALLSEQTPTRSAYRFAAWARGIASLAKQLSNRRSIRDQRQSARPVQQRLVWVAGESVCAVPDVAEIWPKPAVAPPYYGSQPATVAIQLPDGRDAVLIRGMSCTPLGRLKAWLRGRSYRSPGVTLGRLLFHLERYGIPAPRLLAFGQRLTGPVTAEWFALHTRAADPLPKPVDHEISKQLGRLLRQLHDSGCSAGKAPLRIFGLNEHGVCLRDLLSIRLARCETRRELLSLLDALPSSMRRAVLDGYQNDQRLIEFVASKRTKTADCLTPADVNP